LLRGCGAWRKSTPHLLIQGPPCDYDNAAAIGCRFSRYGIPISAAAKRQVAFFIAGGVMAAILIVEDETQVRVLTESYLRDQGHATLSAANTEQAMAVLELPQEIDLLFTDIGLQGDVQAGLTLSQRAIERRPALRVLYTTGLAVTDGMKAMFVEHSAFLPKPYTIDQLQTILSVNFGIKPPAG
jgi:CheY-like chemotaxis protein